jgi:N utilization substance protein B
MRKKVNFRRVHMKRRKARETAISIVFESDFHYSTDVDQLISDVQAEFDETGELELSFDEYSIKLIKGTLKNLEQIDKLIAFSLQNWRFDRISKMSKAMLRVALYEIIFENLPPAIAIDEMLEIAKKYESKDAASFVNGVLGKAVKQIEDGKV